MNRVKCVGGNERKFESLEQGAAINLSSGSAIVAGKALMHPVRLKSQRVFAEAMRQRAGRSLLDVLDRDVLRQRQD